MDQGLKNLLSSFDDAQEWYAPKHFDYFKKMESVRNVTKLLEEHTGYKFEIDESVQDASFFTEIKILESSIQERKDKGLNYLGLYSLFIRFSSFGNLVTMSCRSDFDLGQDDIIKILRNEGYIYIDPKDSDEPYDGKNKSLIDEYTWWDRYFSYM